MRMSSTPFEMSDAYQDNLQQRVEGTHPNPVAATHLPGGFTPEN